MAITSVFGPNVEFVDIKNAMLVPAPFDFAGAESEFSVLSRENSGTHHRQPQCQVEHIYEFGTSVL